MMEPPPAATFEMIEAEFVLELLVVPLDPPAQVSQPDEGGQGAGSGHNSALRAAETGRAAVKKRGES